jgi:hypothetical protein
MRVIIRFSLDDDKNSKLRSKLNAVLRKYGITLRLRTGTYEGIDIGTVEIEQAMIEFWSKAQTLYPAKIDHFWMYADKKAAATKKVPMKRKLRRFNL